MPAIAVKPPLVAVLKNEKLEVIQEVEIPLERFPDMIELPQRKATEPFEDRLFFRIGITDRRAVYREGVSYRISQ
jgi:hypothetical protein